VTSSSVNPSIHCEGCPGARDPEGTHHPTLELTHECPYSCVHCYARRTRPPEPGLYGDPSDSPAVTVSQYGEPTTIGEPLLEVPAALRGLGFRRIDLQTRGYAIDLAEELADAFDLVMVSLDVTDPETHLKVHGKDIDRTLKFLRTASGGTAKVILRTVYLPGLNDDMPDLIEEEGIHVDEVFVQPLIPFPGVVEELKRYGLEEGWDVPGRILRFAERLSDVAPRVGLPACWLDSLEALKGYMEEELGFVDLNSVRYRPEPGDPVPRRDRTPLEELPGFEDIIERL